MAKKSKKQILNLVVILEDGRVNISTGAIIGSDKNSVTVSSQKYKQKIKIPKKFIQKNRVLLSLQDGKLKNINSSMWPQIDISKYGIKKANYRRMTERNQQMKGAYRRWFPKGDPFRKLGTWFTYLLVAIIAGVALYFTYQEASKIIGQVFSARTMSCSQLLPKASLPTDLIPHAVQNVTQAAKNLTGK